MCDLDHNGVTVLVLWVTESDLVNMTVNQLPFIPEVISQGMREIESREWSGAEVEHVLT